MVDIIFIIVMVIVMIGLIGLFIYSMTHPED